MASATTSAMAGIRRYAGALLIQQPVQAGKCLSRTQPPAGKHPVGRLPCRRNVTNSGSANRIVVRKTAVRRLHASAVQREKENSHLTLGHARAEARCRLKPAPQIL